MQQPERNDRLGRTALRALRRPRHWLPYTRAVAWAARSLLVFAAGVVAAWLATENRSAACTHPPEPHPRTGPRPRLVVTQLHWCFYLAVVLQLAACTADSPTRRRAVLSGLAVEAVVTAIVFWTGLTDLNHCLDAP